MNAVIQEFFDLNQQGYLLWYVLGTILTVLLAGKFLSRKIAVLGYNILKKAGRKINKHTYYTLLIKPLKNIIVGVVILVALDKLYLPKTVNHYVLYGKITLRDVLETLSVIILIFLFIKLFICIIDYLAAILEERANLTVSQSDNQLIVFFKDFFIVLLVVAGFLLVLKFGFHQHIGNLLTGLSIVGAAIALATKESLENLIASFIIFFDKPFITGDEVKVQQITGTIEKIGLRSTRIRTLDKTYITVPNKQMVDTIVDNHSLRTKRKVLVKLELSQETRADQLAAVKSELLALLAERKEVENYSVHFAEITRDANILELEYFLPPTTDVIYQQSRDSVNFACLKILENRAVLFSSQKEG
jgi:MscS family membrane protein